jgi:hypothetical protein
VSWTGSVDSPPNVTKGTEEHSFLKDNLNLRSKLNFPGESGGVVSPSIFSQRNRVPTQLTTVNDPFRSVTTTRKSMPESATVYDQWNSRYSKRSFPTTSRCAGVLQHSSVLNS